MLKRIAMYLVVAGVFYAIGTASTLQAQSKETGTGSQNLVEVNKKLDKILANQEEIKSSLNRIFSKV